MASGARLAGDHASTASTRCFPSRTSSSHLRSSSSSSGSSSRLPMPQSQLPSPLCTSELMALKKPNRFTGVSSSASGACSEAFRIRPAGSKPVR
eukprot:CAMPEP_0119392478 /NCGR_PEP_ID=MMETSP1334-20130426/121299_1 /TAXON_ID=127549 /ORGANISM="Calcidiscus leptoporus, Strain RCC1130" /LENGTH=93 /DNA_ID=CAMNT_0007415333 /DNA_START=29 /DNA_END=310 /DNA_ORIENTATION=-